jgi:hypothetical protein
VLKTKHPPVSAHDLLIQVPCPSHVPSVLKDSSQVIRRVKGVGVLRTKHPSASVYDLLKQFAGTSQFP